VDDAPGESALVRDERAASRVTSDERSALRGPAVARVGRGFWLVTSAVLLLVGAAVLLVSVISTVNDNARLSRLKSHGIPVTVTVTGCFGNLGGSGSNAAGFTCHGSYALKGVRYQELIGSMTTLTRVGTTVRGVVDPSHHDVVVLARAVRTSSTSSGSYVVEGLLAVLIVLLTFLLVRVVRRTAPPHSRNE